MQDARINLEGNPNSLINYHFIEDLGHISEKSRSNLECRYFNSNCPAPPARIGSRFWHLFKKASVRHNRSRMIHLVASENYQRRVTAIHRSLKCSENTCVFRTPKNGKKHSNSAYASPRGDDHVE
jgi:hypothetical protein